MLFLQRRPAPPLDAFIESIWVCQNEPVAPGLERVLPTGAPQLIVNLEEDQTRVYLGDHAESCVTSPGTILSGITTRSRIIDTAEQQTVLGVSFRPGGTIPFFAVPADELCDADVPVEALWDRSRTARLRTELLSTPLPDARLGVVEHALRAIRRTLSLHPAVAFALHQFRERPHVATVGAVIAAVGLSPKRFIERFKTEVGLTPKRYCRILRFQRTLARAHAARRIDWSELAVACGYFDQAHLIHDFRAFAGITPTAYLASRTPFQNHVTFLQSESTRVARQCAHG